MDIENPYDLPGEVMMSSLMIEIEEILKTAGGSVTQASADWTLASKAYSDFRCGLTIPREEWLDSHSEEDEKLQAHLHAMETQYVSKLNQLVAVKGMKHVRIVLNKAHFPGISDHRNIRSWASGLGAAGANFVSPTSIRETVVNLLANQTIVSCEDGMSSFSLRRSMAKAGHWLHTIVEHNPMEEGENAADYYFNNFLTPVDHIAKWLQIPGKYGRMVSYFLIELGSTKLPPRKVTAGRVKEHFVYAQKNWLYRPDLIKSYTADIKYYEQCYAGNYPPNIKRARLNKIAHLSELEQQKKNLDATIIKLDAYPEHAYIPDRYEMTSHVKFNLQYCPLCNTTKHSFKDCRERGCNICDSRNHPDYRCPMKCTCRSGRIHAYEGCSHPRAGTKSKRKNASLHEMRAENAKIKAIFLQNLANRDTSNVEEVSTSSQQATQATSNPSTRVNESSANTVNPVSPTRPLNSNSMANSLPPSQEASQGGVHPQSVMDSSQAATATPMSSMDLSESFLQAHCPPQATTPRDVDPESKSSMGDGSEPDIQSNDESMDDEQQLQGSGGSHTSGPQGDAPQPGSVVNSRWADTPAAVESHQL
ncbi:hypothetical protein OY671_006787 [Metschnikowia pulcherrima]|nr:hypothetical protein OY671_006787 [Metschnikowia pulcherrima]